jgi:hypothetical protein
MQYVILAQHRPDLCPTSNAKVRQKLQNLTPHLEAIQTKHQVKIQSIHILGLSHKMVALLEAPSAEAVRDFGLDAGLVQWNEVEIYPAWTMDVALERAAALDPIAW